MVAPNYGSAAAHLIPAARPEPSWRIDLPSSVGTCSSPDSAVLGLVMVGMDLACRTDGGKRMLYFAPLDSWLSLRPLDLHRHL